MENKPAQQSEILIYTNPDGTVKVDVILEDETVWLTQEQMAMLFGKGRSTVTEHIKNIFSEGELDENVVCRNFRLTTRWKEHKLLEKLKNFTSIVFLKPYRLVGLKYLCNWH